MVLSELTLCHRAIPDISFEGHATKHILKFLIHSLHKLLYRELLSFLVTFLVKSKFNFILTSKLIFDVLAAAKASELTSLHHDSHLS